MKKNVKIAIAFMFVLFMALLFAPHSSYATTTSVSTEDDLISTIEGANNGDIIKLTDNIVLTKPIGITDKTITIDGNGKTISATDAESWIPSGQNSTLITAGAGAKVTLTHLTLKDAIKYGVQAYNGGYVILNDVTVTNCKYGGILVNAGTVEVVDLKLQRNGGEKNNGIEIAKGFSVDTGDNEPTLIMNGTLSSTEKENVIYLAVNDTLTGFEVKNSENTVNKIFINDNKVVITDKNENILYTSNARDDLDLEGAVFVPNVTVTIHVKDKTVTMNVKEGSVLKEDAVKAAIDLNKLGFKNYTLDGFYKDEKYKTKFTFGEKITSDTAIYAKVKEAVKDTTPKTGTEETFYFALSVIALSSIAIVTLKRKVR